MPFDQNKMVGTVLLDLSKAFNSAPHDLLITKLDIYGFDKESLSFMYLYLKFRNNQCVLTTNTVCFLEVASGVLQGLVLSILLLNIFLYDLLLFIKGTLMQI